MKCFFSLYFGFNFILITFESGLKAAMLFVVRWPEALQTFSGVKLLHLFFSASHHKKGIESNGGDSDFCFFNFPTPYLSFFCTCFSLYLTSTDFSENIN